MRNDNRVVNGGGFPRIAPEQLGEIIADAADIALVIDSESRRIHSVLTNSHHRSFGRLTQWEGRSIETVLTSESVAKLRTRLREMGAGEGAVRPIELNHVDEDVREFPVQYVLRPLATAGAILMLGRDLRPIAEMQQQLVKAQLALEQDYESQREMDTRYRVLMDSTRDAMVIVSMSSGKIVDLNAGAATLLGATRQDLIGGAIAQEFDGRRRSEFMESMATRAGIETVPPMELQARRSRRKLLVTPTMFRAAGERLLLCRLDAAGAGEGISDDLGEQLTALYQTGADAIVFTDPDGLIRGANESFLNLIDTPSLAAVRGRSLADFLARGAIDLKVLIDNARRTGQLRLYATRLMTAYEAQVAVEMSVTCLDRRGSGSVAFVIRDASRAEALRRPGMPGPEDAARSVMDLVGASTLKEIVAQTADVVEKMCIETAVELTRNNRVAAAEMLGVSRQSLYVKLRKYGLLSKDDE